MTEAPVPRIRRCRNGVAAAFLIALTGCAPAAPVLGSPPNPPAAATPPVAASPAVAVPAPSQRFLAFVGPRQQHAAPFLGVAGTNFFCLRSLLDRQTGEAVHQLYVSDSYSGPEQFWEAARDGSGNPLRFVAISRREITCLNGCAYDEDFAADIPESELRASAHGLVVTFAARTGAAKTITVPGAAVAAQLAAFDAGRRALVAPAASPQH